jgi:hypothetical protein
MSFPVSTTVNVVAASRLRGLLLVVLILSLQLGVQPT